MKTIRNFSACIAALLLSSQLLTAAPLADDKAVDLKVMLEALSQVEPVPFDQLPKEKYDSFGFWSFQNPTGPPLPGNPLKLKWMIAG